MPENYVKVAQASAVKPGRLAMTKVGDVEVMIANLDGESLCPRQLLPPRGLGAPRGHS